MGHTYESINTYTWAQFHKFAKAARKQLGMQLQLTALAARGEDKAFQATVKELLS